MEGTTYLIRYGVMGHVGRFTASLAPHERLRRGQVVVVQTERGVELGEVLNPLADGNAVASNNHPGNEGEASSSRATRQKRVLRAASSDDLANVRRVEGFKANRIALCERILQEENWPWELVDLEVLLDDSAMVVHYLGPHQLDVAPLRARFRMAYDLDVVLEPVGANPASEEPDEVPPAADGELGCGTCGSCAGGCGNGTTAEEAALAPAAMSSASACAPTPHAGCASCGIKKMVAARRQ